ncbi:MAG TPA: ankyrin repeat domain-containing protein [Acidimicrobiia bacterium]|nr:ankyrin repeat domain-containing protein [Acidimicrobiia bacterium]
MSGSGALAVLTVLALVGSCSGGDDRSLSAAVADGDVAAVTRLLAAGFSPEGPRTLGLTPLMRAANRDDAAIGELLLRAGANPDATDFAGVTALHVAARADAVQVARLLLAAGADPHRRSAGGMNALDHAADAGAVGVIDLLADAGVDLDAQSAVISKGHGHPRDVGSTPLGLAVRAKQTRSVIRLLQRGAAVDSPSASGSTPLLQAIYHDAPVEILLILLDAGADPSVTERCDAGCSRAVSGRGGLTAREWAVALGRDELLPYLPPEDAPVP